MNKQFYIRVESWECDADKPQTHTILVNSLEIANEWGKILNMCKSYDKFKAPSMLGNCTRFTDEQIEIVEKFLLETILPNNFVLGDWFEYAWEELMTPVLGESDYICRVVDKYEIIPA